jgi:RibD C-terminal domain
MAPRSSIASSRWPHCGSARPRADHHAKLICTAITSLDGYTADRDGKFDWSAPSEEMHAFINDLERPIGTYLYGRRLYETMIVWEHAAAFVGESPAMQDYARIWQFADKVVFANAGHREQHPDAARAELRSDTVRGVEGRGFASHQRRRRQLGR